MIDEQILKQCRTVDLYDFLLNFAPYDWKKEGKHYLRHKEHNSCVVTKGKGFIWNSHNLQGSNPINFLLEFYNLNFKQAVQAIQAQAIYMQNNTKPTNPCTTNHTYKIVPKPWSELFTYLCSKRCLDKTIIDNLIDKKKIYLTTFKNHRNICFYDSLTQHFECIGIGNQKFKQVSDGKNYWFFGKSNTKAYITESAIDAISLYQIINEHAIYISIAGSTTRTKVIDKIIKNFDEVILAVDNDTAGNQVAEFYPYLKRIIPFNKDWNEDLVKLNTHNK